MPAENEKTRRFEEVLSRLPTHHEFIYAIDTEEELKELFSDFECLTTGYFDQSMFALKNNFHWIWAGTKTV